MLYLLKQDEMRRNVDWTISFANSKIIVIRWNKYVTNSLWSWTNISKHHCATKIKTTVFTMTTLHATAASNKTVAVHKTIDQRVGLLGRWWFGEYYFNLITVFVLKMIILSYRCFIVTGQNVVCARWILNVFELSCYSCKLPIDDLRIHWTFKWMHKDDCLNK